MGAPSVANQQQFANTITLIAQQLQTLLPAQVSRTRGVTVASRIAVAPEPRLNRVSISAPAFVMPVAEKLIAELDQKPTTGLQVFQVIPLQYADATQVAATVNDQLSGSGRSSP